MTLLSFDDWFDKYGERIIDEHATPLQNYSLDEFLMNEYEIYVSDYEDYAYEQYKDQQLWENN